MLRLVCQHIEVNVMYKIRFYCAKNILRFCIILSETCLYQSKEFIADDMSKYLAGFAINFSSKFVSTCLKKQAYLIKTEKWHDI